MQLINNNFLKAQAYYIDENKNVYILTDEQFQCAQDHDYLIHPVTNEKIENVGDSVYPFFSPDKNFLK